MSDPQPGIKLAAAAGGAGQVGGGAINQRSPWKRFGEGSSAARVYIIRKCCYHHLLLISWGEQEGN